MAFPPSAQATPKDNGEVRMYDLVVDDNTIEHWPVGIQIGAQTRGVVLNNNHFQDVERPYAIARPESVKVIE